MQSHPIPEDLLALQRALLDAEQVWRARVADLYAHPAMARALEEGRREELVAEVRRAARAS